MVLASSQTSVGAVILFVAFALAIGYAFINNRNSRAEIGSEIEIAPNRKPYLSDEELEGKKLDRTLTFGLIGLFTEYKKDGKVTLWGRLAAGGIGLSAIFAMTSTDFPTIPGFNDRWGVATTFANLSASSVDKK